MSARIPSVAIPILLAILAGGCVHCTGPDRATNDALYKTWMELHEARSGDVRTYHDPSFAFPAARGREGFTIKADGEFIWHRIAPTDGIMNVPARWHREDGSDGVLVVTDPANGDVSWIVILSVEPGTLTARVES